MRWFCLICFIAGILVLVGFGGLIAFAINTHLATAHTLRAMFLFWAFLLYATWVMFRGYRQRG